MKKLSNAALCSNGKYFAAHPFLYGVTRYAALFFSSMILICFLFTGCKKQDINAPENDTQLTSNTVMNTEEEFRRACIAYTVVLRSPTKPSRQRPCGD